MRLALTVCLAAVSFAQTSIQLPNGWKITPLGESIPTEDLLLNIQGAPDGKAVVALHGDTIRTASW